MRIMRRRTAVIVDIDRQLMARVTRGFDVAWIILSRGKRAVSGYAFKIQCCYLFSAARVIWIRLVGG